MKKLLTTAILLFGLNSSEATLENRIENIDSDRLVELVGEPDEGSVLEKVSDLFFESTEPVNLRIEKRALNEYFRRTENEEVRKTAEEILNTFKYIEINSEIGGGVEVGLSDIARFSVDVNGIEVKCELSPYKSTILDKFVSDSGRISYVFEVDSGYSKLDIPFRYDILIFITRKNGVPNFKGAEYVLAFGGEYYALFDENGEKMDRIFDVRAKRYGEDILEENYDNTHEKAVKCIKNDVLESFK